MPHRNFNQSHPNTGVQGYNPDAPFQTSNMAGRYTHEQKVEYATHVHGAGYPQAEAQAYRQQGQSYQQMEQSYAGPGQYGQSQSYQQQASQQQSQQDQSNKQQQQQMKQRIQQQYSGQYSQLSTKDFNYLKDHMSWELLATKKCYHYAQECQDQQVANLINQMGQMHERHYLSLLQYFQPENVQ